MEYDSNPFYISGVGFIDNIKNKIDLNLGFDMSLIKRDELNVNLIHFDKNMQILKIMIFLIVLKLM